MFALSHIKIVYENGVYPDTKEHFSVCKYNHNATTDELIKALLSQISNGESYSLHSHKSGQGWIYLVYEDDSEVCCGPWEADHYSITLPDIDFKHFGNHIFIPGSTYERPLALSSIFVILYIDGIKDINRWAALTNVDGLIGLYAAEHKSRDKTLELGIVLGLFHEVTRIPLEYKDGRIVIPDQATTINAVQEAVSTKYKAKIGRKVLTKR